MRSPLLRAALTAALALSSAGCGSKPQAVDVDPPSLRFGLRGQTAKLHATPRAAGGRAMPESACAWSSSDEKVATVAGKHNDAQVTAAGPGSAAIRCTVEGVTGEAPVVVRVVSRVEVAPAKVALRMLDEPAPVALEVRAYDDTGSPVTGRAALSRCADEGVCRGDGRGQLWAVGPGSTTAVVEVEGATSAPVAVAVTDARTAEGRPQAVKGNPMEAIEREVREREAKERAAGR
jgi:hypothetical protein